MLTSIELTGFRGFHQLKLEGLSRVNLIVGKNNSGKTSLLEAIERCDRKSWKEGSQLRLNDNDAENLSWLVNDHRISKTAKIAIYEGASVWKMSIEKHGKPPVQSDDPTAFYPTLETVTIPTQQKNPSELGRAVSGLVRIAGAKKLLVESLRVIDDRIQDLSPVTDEEGVIVDIGLSKHIPVSLVGQGVYRLMEVYSEIIGSNAKVCLIDEIENGIHHSSLIDVWKGIADASERFNVQIFATTHSQECIEAAHEAFSERPSYDLSVIQLFRKTNSVQGRVLDNAHITAAMTGEIDLRG